MKSLYTILIASLFVGCTKNFDRINTDPTRSSEQNVVPEYNFTRALLEYTGNSDYSYDTWRVNIIYCGMMMQQLSNVTWYAGDKYTQNDGWANSYFERAFVDQVKYIEDVEHVTFGNPYLVNLYQMNRIARVMVFHRITDLYGDIPYSEAGHGYSERKTTPKYDSQEDIYMDMLKELADAAQKLDFNKEVPGAGDLIYNKGGTVAVPDVVDHWRKLAYSLMLRLAMRMTKKDITIAQYWAEKAYQGGVFTSNEDNAYILHDANGGRTTVNRVSNILSGEWNAINNPGEASLAKTYIDFLQTNNDPRLNWVARVPATGSTLAIDQLGMPNGFDINGTNSITDISKHPDYPGDLKRYSVLNKDVMLKLNGPTFLVTYSQTELLLAEAAKRGWEVGDAATHYQNGVRAAMEQLRQYDASAVIPSAEIDNYLLNHPYDDTFDQINTQYWATCILDWYEAFANWRRSGYPALVPVNYSGNATGGQIPRRMLYPSSEAASNGKNYQEAITRQGANSFMTRVWWDKE
jgi:hypothetical protein